MLIEPIFSSLQMRNLFLKFSHAVLLNLYIILLIISVIKLQISKNRKLTIYAFNEMKVLVDHKIACNVVRVETGHVNNMPVVLSKYDLFTDVINFQ